MALSGCGGYDRSDGYYGGNYEHHRGGYSDSYYDGYYDNYYGPYSGGYWASDGYFYYADRQQNYHRDDGRHFRHERFDGSSPFQGEHRDRHGDRDRNSDDRETYGR